jgi:glutathione S-transferase
VLLEYLEDLDVGPRLLPKDPRDRAISRLWVDHVGALLCLCRFFQ